MFLKQIFAREAKLRGQICQLNFQGATIRPIVPNTLIVTVHGKTYFSAYPLDGRNRSPSVSYPLEILL